MSKVGGGGPPPPSQGTEQEDQKKQQEAEQQLENGGSEWAIPSGEEPPKKKKSGQEQPSSSQQGIVLAVILLLMLVVFMGYAGMTSGVVKLPDWITGGTTPIIDEDSLTVPDETDESIQTVPDLPTNTPTPTTSLTGQEALPQGPTATTPPALCADHGGQSYYGELCVCQGFIDQVTICADGTKFDNVTTTACTPDASQCAAGGDSGGAPACTLTVAECNAQGFGSVDAATCTCYGNYKP